MENRVLAPSLRGPKSRTALIQDQEFPVAAILAVSEEGCY